MKSSQETLQKVTGNHCSILPSILWKFIVQERKTTALIGSDTLGMIIRSPGCDSHVPQVKLNRHPATDGINNIISIKKVTWNVRTFYQCGKLENLKQETSSLCETRWANTGSFQSDEFKFIHSSGKKHEKGACMMIDRLCIQEHLRVLGSLR